jgi:hypothetical protein
LWLTFPLIAQAAPPRSGAALLAGGAQGIAALQIRFEARPECNDGLTIVQDDEIVVLPLQRGRGEVGGTRSQHAVVDGLGFESKHSP